MSWSSEWFKDWVVGGGRTQLDLARLAKVDAASVSRWINGQARPDREAMGTLLNHLPDDEAAALAVAWTKDLLPDEAVGLVEIKVRSSRVAEVAPDSLPEGLSADLREKLAYFGRLAATNASLRKILDVCHDAAKRSGY